jgi:hypothetical protein
MTVEPREKERACESAVALERREEEHGEGPATLSDDESSASSDAAAEKGARR